MSKRKWMLLNMSKAFGHYALYYDLLYSDKDYEGECDFIEEIFEKYADKKPNNILDIGCGAGGHIIPLVKRGYSLVGLDLSATMLEFANKKIKKLNMAAELYRGDINHFNLYRKFDACLCMFAVLNYVTSNEGLLQSLKNIRNHLNDGGLLIFDFWYGPAVLNIKPSVRVKEVESDGMRVLRIVEPEMDVNQHICNAHYHLIAMKGKKILADIKETHKLRYLFPLEIQCMLEENKFELLHISEFPDLETPPSEKTWNVAVVAKAI